MLQEKKCKGIQLDLGIAFVAGLFLGCISEFLSRRLSMFKETGRVSGSNWTEVFDGKNEQG